jgi:hypothetical protein
MAQTHGWRQWSITAAAVPPWSSIRRSGGGGGNGTLLLGTAAAATVAGVVTAAVVARHTLLPSEEPALSDTTTALQLVQQKRYKKPLRPFREAAAARCSSVYNLSISQFQRSTQQPTLCEKRADLPVASPSQPNSISPEISWTWRERLLSLVGMRLSAPPLPRRLCHRDAVWTLTNQQQQQRARDELEARQILDRIIALTNSGRATTAEQTTTHHAELSRLQVQWLETVYGPGVTLADRQAFLERYGCTAWTDEILDVLLVEYGHLPSGATASPNKSRMTGDAGGQYHRGFVEIGAGNGQWARVLTDRHRALTPNQQPPATHKHFELVLAYDNYSRIPLDHGRYNARSPVARAHFYDRVRPVLDNDAMTAVLQQWATRGRILLLVYPPPESDMALTALQAYDRVGHTTTKTTTTTNDASGNVGMLVYVGEQRGGANASEAFFDYLEDPVNNWILHRVMNVVSFGSKGYEKLYIFQKGNTMPDSS